MHPSKRRIDRSGITALLVSVAFVWGSAWGPAAAQEVPFADRALPQVVDDDILVGPAQGGAPYPGLTPAWTRVSTPFAADPFIAWRNVTAITGNHTWRVFRCDGPASTGTLPLSAIVTNLNAQAVSYFQTLSRGRYNPGYASGGTFGVVDPGNWIGDCFYDEAVPYGWHNPLPGGQGYLAISEDYGPNGLGGPGAWIWRQAGSNEEWELVSGSRQAAVGGASASYSSAQFEEWVTPIVLHEVGHGIGWPHVPIRGEADPYGNPLDIMSGGLFPVQGTAAINLYGSGWIDRSEVATWSGGPAQVRLGTIGTSRTKILIIPTDNPRVYYTVSVQPTAYGSSTPWGLVVHEVDQTDNGEIGYCPGANTCTLVSRRVELVPPDGWNGVEVPLITPGRSLEEGHWTVTVAASHSDGYTVGIESTGFIDTVGHLFESEIDELADAGITRGCNPPVNSRFCPNDPVTRGQMAAFLVRALGLPVGSKVFSDTAGHLFQDEISKLEAAGITRGCNPPANTRFCPDQPVTRGQMAAFLVRALGLAPGSKVFTDTAGHLFQAEISRLEAAGITRGCNPPANTRFCPNDPVTRGQMAAFLVRAGLTD